MAHWADVEKVVGTTSSPPRPKIRRRPAKRRAKGGSGEGRRGHGAERQATRDSVRAALMRYRMRGHFMPSGPAGIEAPRTRKNLDPRHLWLSRKAISTQRSSSEHVWVRRIGSLRAIVAICERTYCQTLGVEFFSCHFERSAENPGTFRSA